MKFDTDCALLNTLLDQYFYKGLRSLIELWINKDDQELFA